MPKISIYWLPAMFMIGSLVSCTEKNTDDPVKAYNLWAGEVPGDIQVIHGKYWQSAHFTKEYIMYLELKASPIWRKQFIQQNHLIETKEKMALPGDAPVWFKPTKSFKIYTPPGFLEDSLYWFDSLSERMFIYEIQL